MDDAIRAHLVGIHSSDRTAQGEAYHALMAATEGPVDWAYEAWDGLVKDLSHKDNHLRSIASQVLCNLAKSDPEGRMLKDFDVLIAVTKDERFVTARHCLLALWKIGLVGKEQQKRLVDGLSTRYAECVAEKNGTLIRDDIIRGFRKLYDQVNDETIRTKALALIETEEDPKYRKKYAAHWKTK